MADVAAGLQRPPDGPETLMLEKAALPLMVPVTMP
jgi:hypothetical protein